MTNSGDPSDELRDDAGGRGEGGAGGRAGGRAGGDPVELPSAELWLADGYNLLHCAPFRGKRGSSAGAAFWSAEKRERLVQVARGFAHPHRALWIAFDGPRENAQRIEAGREHTGSLHVVFAASADDWIVRRVKEVSGHPDLEGRDPFALAGMQSVAVVSGDRKLGNRARHHGAAVVSPRSFLAQCGVVGPQAPSPHQAGEPSEREPR